MSSDSSSAVGSSYRINTHATTAGAQKFFLVKHLIKIGVSK